MRARKGADAAQRLAVVHAVVVIVVVVGVVVGCGWCGAVGQFVKIPPSQNKGSQRQQIGSSTTKREKNGPTKQANDRP